MIWLAATAPWILVIVYSALVVRRPRRLPTAEPANLSTDTDDFRSRPLVSIIVPARNEADSIRLCLESLTTSTYPRFEILVVDDRSEDGTGEIARSVDPGNASRLAVIDGDPLPDGWLGKPWACLQGYEESRGDLLLFTDADTRHAPDLLERSVAALLDDPVVGAEGADDVGPAGALTLMGRQLMETFWEKVVQPQVMVFISFRFPRLDRELEPEQWRETVANGQYILFRRETYEAIGGHESVRDEVAEDLRLAQILCAGGHRLLVREAEDGLATRMYRSLGHIVEGWSKNMSIGARQTLPTGAHRIVFPLALAVGVGLWLVPPAASLAALIALGGGYGVSAWGWWAFTATGLSVAFWWTAAARSRIRPAWGLLYPLGAAVGMRIFLRSWLRGNSVEWKGRRYRVNTERVSGGPRSVSGGPEGVPRDPEQVP